VFQLILSATTIFAQDKAGSITEVEGDTTLVRGSQHLNGTVGTEVHINDRLLAGTKSHATITLDDGTQLILRETISIVINGSFSGAAHTDPTIDLFKGHLRSPH
jgi:hypothetical protein